MSDESFSSFFVFLSFIFLCGLPFLELEQISIKGNTMAVGDNVGAGLVPAQSGACRSNV
jgi:hypothetical protein